MAAMIPAHFDEPLHWAPCGARLDVLAIKNAGVREIGLRLCEAMGAWTTGRAGPPDLELVGRSLAYDSRVLSPLAAVALGELIVLAPDPVVQLLDIYRAAPAFSRRMILRWVRGTRPMPRPLMVRLFAEAEADRSKLVREWAAYQAGQVGLRKGRRRVGARRS
jgi:hypothetical protein